MHPGIKGRRLQVDTIGQNGKILGEEKTLKHVNADRV